MSAEARVATPSTQHRTAFARAMPWLFVLIWSTGFVVARLAMPHAPPFGFLTLRFVFSAACFAVWIAAVRAPWPRGRTQGLHLAVVPEPSERCTTVIAVAGSFAFGFSVLMAASSHVLI